MFDRTVYFFQKGLMNILKIVKKKIRNFQSQLYRMLSVRVSFGSRCRRAAVYPLAKCVQYRASFYSLRANKLIPPRYKPCLNDAARDWIAPRQSYQAIHLSHGTSENMSIVTFRMIRVINLHIN